MRGLCDTMRTFRESSPRFGESIRKPIVNLLHPSNIGALVDLMLDQIILIEEKNIKFNDCSQSNTM